MAISQVSSLSTLNIGTIQPADDFVVRDHSAASGTNSAMRISFGNLDSRWKELPDDLGSAGQVATVNQAGNAVVWATPSSQSGGISTFLGLSDTPAVGSYASNQNDVLTVNGAGNAVVFNGADLIDWKA